MRKWPLVLAALLIPTVVFADTGVGLTKSVILQTLDDLGVTTNGVYTGGGGGGGDIKSDGTVAFAADESMSNHKLTLLATPTVSTDAANKGYVDGYFTSQSANKVLASPSGGSGVPTYRLLVASDLPAIPLATVLTGGNTTGTNNISINTGQKILGAAELTLSANNGALALRTEQTQPINFVTFTTLRWAFDLNGHMIAGADNTYDIGTPDGGLTLLRPRNVYAATLVNSPTTQVFKSTIIENTLPSSSSSGQANLVMDSATHQVKLSVNAGGYGTVFGDGIAAIGSKTVTVSGTPILNLDQTWNASGQAFTAVMLNITDTASSANSNFVCYRVGGVGNLYIRKSGALVAGDAVASPSVWTLTGQGATGSGHAGKGIDFLVGLSGDTATASGSFNFKVAKAGAGQTYLTALTIDSTGTLSSPYQGNANSEHFGNASVATGFLATAIGDSATADHQYGTAVGRGAGVTGDYSTAVGAGATTQTFASQSVAIGVNAGCLNSAPDCVVVGAFSNSNNFANCVVLGSTASSTAAGQFIVGSSTKPITDVWIGNGASGNAPAAIHFNGAKITSGSGSPESAVTAGVGSLYLRLDGGANTTLYVKESGSGNTGWVGK